eukprot:m.235225 g.235225  ORF g.235225 m.235225 type:complete len:110 (+) comp15259_c0_seq10:2836-3165(+)
MPVFESTGRASRDQFPMMEFSMWKSHNEFSIAFLQALFGRKHRCELHRQIFTNCRPLRLQTTKKFKEKKKNKKQNTSFLNNKSKQARTWLHPFFDLTFLDLGVYDSCYS